MWGFSRYNVIVQQVEGVSDVLREAADRIESLVGLDPSGVAGKLYENLRLTVDELDLRALWMLSFYDPAAGDFIRAGVVRDPRRGPWRRKSPPAEAIDCSSMGQDWPTPAQIAAEGGKRPKKPLGFKRAKRLKAGR